MWKQLPVKHTKNTFNFSFKNFPFLKKKIKDGMNLTQKQWNFQLLSYKYFSQAENIFFSILKFG